MSEKLIFSELFGVQLNDNSSFEIVHHIVKRIFEKGKSFYIVTPNPEIIMYAQNNPEFKNILNKAAVSLPDGVGVVFASLLLGKGVHQKVSGIDTIYSLCDELSKKHGIAGFLGGKGAVADSTAERLSSLYPGLRIGYIEEEWDETGFKEQLEKRNVSHLDILFVAYGFPKQEEWVARHIGKLPVKCFMVVGGSFDMISGRVPRAPRAIRDLGFEWLYRLIIQPWRWRRQLALLSFLFLVLKTKLSQEK